MDLSPNDIRTYQFKNQMRGFNREEVESFLGQVASCVEELNKQQIKLSTENDSLKSQLAGLKEFEETIKNAAIDARRNADLTMAEAKAEAEKILTKAGERAEELLEERRAEVQRVEEDIKKLELAKKSYLSKLRTMISNHLEMLDDLASADPIAESEPVTPLETDNLAITETLEVNSGTMGAPVSMLVEQESIETADAIEVSEIDQVEPPTELKSRGPVDDEDLTESLRQVVKDEQTETPPSDQPAEEPKVQLDDQQAEEPEDLNATGPISEDIQVIAQQAEAAPAADAPPQDSKSPNLIDLDLAAALNKYQQDHVSEANEQPETPPAEEETISGAVIDEASVPDGFTTPEQELAQSDTAEIPTNGDTADSRNEASPDKKSDDTLDPENLASALDSVAAKFEEEMDRASRS